MAGFLRQGMANVLRRAPPIKAFLSTDAWRAFRHRYALVAEPRRSYTFTRFLRLPTQFAALAGPVVETLVPEDDGRPLNIVVLGCSIGAEPYSIASVLANRRPDLKFQVRASDLDVQVITRARTGAFSAREVFMEPNIPPDFVRQTFDTDDAGATYTVKPEIAQRVTFAVADVLDPTLPQRMGEADILYIQNLLVNLPLGVAKRAFRNVCRLLRPRAALFLDGVPLTLRHRLTRAAGLVPLDHEIHAIHEEARALHGAAWPWHYWGLEPFDGARRDWQARYATIFLRQPITGRG